MSVDPHSDIHNSTDFARLEGQLFERVTEQHRRRVIRHRLVATVAIVVVAGTGVAAGTIANQSQQSNVAYCYRSDSLTSRVTEGLLPDYPTLSSQPGSKPATQRIAYAVAICKGAWKDGMFSRSTDVGPFAVPKLQVCLRDDLIVSVFRKTNSHETPGAFCEGLGLSAP